MYQKLYTVEILSGRNSTYYFKDYLYENGMRYTRKGKKFVGKFSNESHIDKLRIFCKSNKLVFIVYDEYKDRSNDYRERFFKKNPPLFFDKYYVCAYCFKPLKLKSVTVDHIISVKKAKTNRMVNYLLKRLKIDDINDERNLCACCTSCNSKKGSKAGFWLIRGFLGKKKIIIYSVYTFFILFLSILIYAIYKILSMR